MRHCSDKSTVAAQIINSIHICPVMNSRIGELLCICPILDSWYVNIQTYVLLLYICHVYYQHSQHGIPPSSAEHILTIFAGFLVHVYVCLISISLQMLFACVCRIYFELFGFPIFRF
jgi:hypothetical protein